MHRIVQEKIEDLTQQISAVSKSNEDLELAESIFPEANFYLYNDGDINMSWAAKSMNEVKALLKKFAENKIMLSRFSESLTTPSWILKGEKVKIYLQPYWSSGEAEGVTCRLVKVGEEVTKTPKYKLVCDNGEGYEFNDSGQHEEVPV